MASITPLKNGPYKVEGAQLTDSDGNPIETKETVFLCRCGHSENKPFCDGHHAKVDFQG